MNFKHIPLKFCLSLFLGPGSVPFPHLVIAQTVKALMSPFYISKESFLQQQQQGGVGTQHKKDTLANYICTLRWAAEKEMEKYSNCENY